MSRMMMTKDQLNVGDIVWFRRVDGDDPPPIRRYQSFRSFFLDDYDSDESYFTEDSDPPQERVSPEREAQYQALGLNRGNTNHPCVIIDLLLGRNGDPLKVCVCIVSICIFRGHQHNQCADQERS